MNELRNAQEVPQMRLRRSVRLLMVALALAVALGAAPAALAKGRPMHATYTRTSCFDFDITVTWWKKLSARGVKIDLYGSDDSWYGAWAWGDSAGFASPFSRSVGGGTSTLTMYTVISIYDTADVMPIIGPPPTPLDSVRTAAATFDCGF